MAKDLTFQIPIPQEPEGKPISAEEAERILLERLSKCEQDLESSIWDLVVFYSRVNRQDISLQYLSRLITITDDPEKKAQYFLTMGQCMEQIQDYEAAITFYTRAFSLEPVDNGIWYLINNNLGFCLNYFERYKEAEPYCRAAIKIDPRRHNAYKNLGIAMEGQLQFAEAAKLYVKAVQSNAGDMRSLLQLENLIAKHSEIEVDIPDIQSQLEKCKDAVDLSQKLKQEANDRLNRKTDK